MSHAIVVESPDEDGVKNVDGVVLRSEGSIIAEKETPVAEKAEPTEE
jgi:hypothetical protein